MCGISGTCSLSAPTPPQADILLQMLAAIRHRGPDETGLYLDDRVGLAHARLSIIDLSSGTQPIHNEDKTLWIIFNGELFNYPELRQRLQSRGHTFYTSSDTEVIVHLFEEYGPACLDAMNGQFGLAIWNSRDQELFLARDRVGIRPLHYTILDDQLYFASEIKSLLTVPGIRRQIDPVALEQIFTCWTTLGRRTAFEDIHELPPGHYLLVKDAQIQINRYWQLQFPACRDQSSESLDTIVRQADEILTDAIRIRLRADVPVGAYLSGGLDSSGITAKVARNFNNNLQTFGIRFEEDAFDEGDSQKAMVSHLGVKHSEITATNQRIAESFPEVIYHGEKPILRTAPAPLFLLSEKVRNAGLKVVLTGEGADEVFGGYNIFREAKIRHFWARQPDSQKRAALLEKLYPYIFNNPRMAATLRAFFARDLENTDDPLYSHRIRWSNTAKIKTFLSPEFCEPNRSPNMEEELLKSLPKAFETWHSFAKAQYLESTIFMSNYLLSSQGDRMAMGHSLEIRLPFLDHRLIEFMSRIPARWKVLGLNEKYLLKKIFQNLLPRSVIKRNKHPYRAPIAQTLLSNSTEYLRDVLSERQIKTTGIFDASKIQHLIRKLERPGNTSEVDAMALCGIVSTQILCDQFIHQRRPYKPIEKIDLLIDKRTHKEDADKLFSIREL